MAGTKAGGKAAAATNKAKYGADFYAKIGANGGKKATPVASTLTANWPASPAPAVAGLAVAPRKPSKSLRDLCEAKTPVLNGGFSL